jgi:hypothetical protein
VAPQLAPVSPCSWSCSTMRAGCIFRMIWGSMVFDCAVGSMVSSRIGPGSNGSILLRVMLVDHCSIVSVLEELSSSVGAVSSFVVGAMVCSSTVVLSCIGWLSSIVLSWLIVGCGLGGFGLGGFGGLPRSPRSTHSASESESCCHTLASLQSVNCCSSSVMLSVKASGKVSLTLLIRFLLLAISNARAFFLALSGSFEMYVFTKLTCAHMRQTFGMPCIVSRFCI